MINNNIIIILKVWFRFQHLWTKSQNSTCSAKSLPKTPTSALSNHQLVHIATYAPFPALTRSSSPLPQIRHPPFLFLSFPFCTFLFIYYYLLSVIFIVQIIYRSIICRYGILLTFSAIPTLSGIHTKPPLLSLYPFPHVQDFRIFPHHPAVCKSGV